MCLSPAPRLRRSMNEGFSKARFELLLVRLLVSLMRTIVLLSMIIMKNVLPRISGKR